MKALINLDYTIDFVATDGALTCGLPGQKIEEHIVQVTKEFIQNNDFVVFAIDLHKKMIRTIQKPNFSHHTISTEL